VKLIHRSVSLLSGGKLSNWVAVKNADQVQNNSPKIHKNLVSKNQLILHWHGLKINKRRYTTWEARSRADLVQRRWSCTAAGFVAGKPADVVMLREEKHCTMTDNFKRTCSKKVDVQLTSYT